MSATNEPRRRMAANVVLAYVFAVILPPLGSWLTAHVDSLRSVPFATHFVAIAAVAALGGLWPALLSLGVAVATRGYFVAHAPPGAAPLAGYDLVRILVLLASIGILTVIGGRRRRAELRRQAALDTLQDRTDTLIESLNNSKCASWTLDLDSGTSARWFPGSFPVFGRPFADVEAMPSLRPLVHDEDQHRFPILLKHMQTSTEPAVFEFRCLWPNGELHWLEMRGTRIPGPGRRWRGVTLDITERKLAEGALLHAEKLAAMGRLASTVAHEINNPLESVTNLLYLASADASLTPETRAYLGTAERELARLGNITRLTLGFVRSHTDVTSVEVAPLVDDVLSIFQHRMDTRCVSIQRAYQPTVRIAIPPHELRQIVTNLVANAADAVSPPNATIHIGVFTQDGHAVLTVSDNGSGIAPDHLPRIFEPFFSTKAETGTGIGLWVTRELVEKNKGHIEASSGDLPDGLRTRFRVVFPLVDQLS